MRPLQRVGFLYCVEHDLPLVPPDATHMNHPELDGGCQASTLYADDGSVLNDGVTGRGFRVFAVRERSEDEWLYGEPVSVYVVESSLAGRGPHVRIYEGTEGVQLNLDEAAMVARALMQFIEEAHDGQLTELVDDAINTEAANQ